MKKLSAAALAVFTTASVIGCQPAVVTTPATLPPSRDKETDVHIRTPGANVDVQGKGEGKGVNVDVERKRKDPDR